ncbi:MAG: hypothetical protein ACKOPM_02755 [Novosphingobium sp.]
MNFVTRLLMPLAAVALVAAPVHAQSYRIPAEGTPAIEVTKQAGFTEKYDDYGNLTFFAEDKSGGLLFRTIEAGPTENMPDNAAIAELILGAAGAKPYSKREATSFAGGPAEAFASTMSVGGGPLVEIVVVIRNLDARHLAVGVTMIPETTNAAGREVILAQFGQARIVNR